MNSMSERIEQLINELGITKAKFSETLNISPSYVSRMINKGAIPSERLIEDICEKFEISREWLETGKGSMTVEKSRNEVITDFMSDLLKEEGASYKRRFIEMLANLSIEEWELLEKMALKLAMETLGKDETTNLAKAARGQQSLDMTNEQMKELDKSLKDAPNHSQDRELF